jgi:hypothetical protein
LRDEVGGRICHLDLLGHRFIFDHSRGGCGPALLKQQVAQPSLLLDLLWQKKSGDKHVGGVAAVLAMWLKAILKLSKVALAHCWNGFSGRQEDVLMAHICIVGYFGGWCHRLGRRAHASQRIEGRKSPVDIIDSFPVVLDFIFQKFELIMNGRYLGVGVTVTSAAGKSGAIHSERMTLELRRALGFGRQQKRATLCHSRTG